MKFFKNSTAALVVFGLLLFAFSCNEDNASPEKGTVSFSFASANTEPGRLSETPEPAKYLILSIEDNAGAKIYTQKKITLSLFGTDYISEPLELKPGSFKLTEFMVLNADGNVIYATPLEGSKLAYLVNDPLPILFDVAKDQTTKVTPEVVAIDEFNSALDFGYATFSFDIVKTLSFQLGVFVYNGTTKNFELTTSHLTIAENTTAYYDKDLSNVTSRIVVKEGAAAYTLTISKAGYQNYSKTFTGAELKAFTEANVLKVTLLDNSLVDGLIAYYPFTQNALDKSGNNLNGTVFGATLTTDRRGFANAAYAFDGINDYISVTHSSLLNLPNDFSISLWAEIPNQTTEEGINDILRKWSGDASGYPFSISYLNSINASNPDQLLFVRYDGQGCGHAPTYFSPKLNNTAFIHIMMIKQGNKLRQYLNGVLLAEITDTTTGSACSTSNTTHMTFGTRGQLIRFFKGKIDDVRIYNRAVTANEIAVLYAE